jgi:acetyltransferase-like isoleucine patch superfamily enzyme
MKRLIAAFVREYLPNHVISKIPSAKIRNWCYRIICGIKVGRFSNIMMGCYIYNSDKYLVLGENSVINQRCVIDRRGGLYIGNNVSISPGVSIYTAGHYPDSSDFDCIVKGVRINDYVWIGANAMIMPGVIVGKGAIVLPGAVVTKNVNELEIVGGVPAQFVRMRRCLLRYNPAWFPLFM